MPVIPVLRRLRQEAHKFQANLDYRARLRLQKKEKEQHGRMVVTRAGRSMQGKEVG
jgi:hypothetical protein